VIFSREFSERCHIEMSGNSKGCFKNKLNEILQKKIRS
jgi:hypothetical protein